MKTTTITFLVLGVMLVAGTALYFKPAPVLPPVLVKATDGGSAGQVLEITAKGGYTPAVARAKAGVPLVLKIRTKGTLDCSVQIRIPELGWSKDLAPTEEVDVPVRAQEAGSTLTGVCSMGMYNFKITFE